MNYKMFNEDNNRLRIINNILSAGEDYRQNTDETIFTAFSKLSPAALY